MNAAVAISSPAVPDWKTGTPVWRTSVNTALIWIPVAVLAVGFVVFCEVDLARAEQVRYLPKWGWAILCTGMGNGQGIPEVQAGSRLEARGLSCGRFLQLVLASGVLMVLSATKLAERDPDGEGVLEG